MECSFWWNKVPLFQVMASSDAGWNFLTNFEAQSSQTMWMTKTLNIMESMSMLLTAIELIWSLEVSEGCGLKFFHDFGILPADDIIINERAVATFNFFICSRLCCAFCCGCHLNICRLVTVWALPLLNDSTNAADSLGFFNFYSVHPDFSVIFGFHCMPCLGRGNPRVRAVHVVHL